MKRYVTFSCACWAVNESSSFLTANGAASSLGPLRSAAHQHHLAISDRWRTPAAVCRPRPSPAVMMGTRQGGSNWTKKMASAAVAVSVLVGASVAGPLDAGAAKAPKQEPVVQALVQLPNEEADWTK